MKTKDGVSSDPVETATNIIQMAGAVAGMKLGSSLASKFKGV
ncbi:hypothetical protein [Campylobacter blaseri]|nr:hypothetical protein [Campylobacter blaseri]